MLCYFWYIFLFKKIELIYSRIYIVLLLLTPSPSLSTLSLYILQKHKTDSIRRVLWPKLIGINPYYHNNYTNSNLNHFTTNNNSNVINQQRNDSSKDNVVVKENVIVKESVTKEKRAANDSSSSGSKENDENG